jgi:hypothetical protein
MRVAISVPDGTAELYSDPVTSRAFVSTVVCSALLFASFPRTAHADEGRAVEIVADSLPPPISPEGVRARLALATSPQLGALQPLAPTPTEIRLSPEAKTAIIIGAIVVGVLIIVGVVIVGKPGHIKP